MSYMTISSQEKHNFSLCSCFHAHPTTLLLKILGGTNAWGVPPTSNFWGDRPPQSPPRSPPLTHEAVSASLRAYRSRKPTAVRSLRIILASVSSLVSKTAARLLTYSKFVFLL